MSTPLHPLIVHFPIALLFVGAIVQIIALWRPKIWDTIANFTLITGLITGVIAYMTGDGGERFARQVFGTSESAIHRHENFAFFTLIVFGLLIAIKLYRMFPLIPQLKKYAKYSLSKVFIPLMLVLSLAGGTLIFLTGHYGGELVYQSGNKTVNSSTAKNND
ncbi:hypothetical protein MUG84_07415 [Paenibacillus sp. KQZ6P-2]|uniref:DUF2231 domain-containing protein n=1 Tax=Paenibacillus mangrovi TaxID=2931978 RepID=A0A9X1WLP1_9BACL|nr:DUF2231 domain-containing protein [Paenibacillus mangrovi]MCJ8011577.1 hypothetical protein [Paenibacillus mangrovi]